MDDEEIKQVLRSHSHSQGASGFSCPDETQLAAYVDQQLGAKRRQALERHASRCDYCLETIAFLSQSADWTDSNEIPGYLVTRARALVKGQPSKSWIWRWAFAPAAAACILLAVALLYFGSRVRQPNSPSDAPLIAQNNQPSVPVTAPDVATLQPGPSHAVTKPNLNRGTTASVRGSESELKPVLVFPREGAVLHRQDLRFEWKPIEGAAYYTVRLVTADGSTKLEKDTKQLSLTVDDQVELHAGGIYYVTIFAYRNDGSLTKSEIMKFRLTED